MKVISRADAWAKHCPFTFNVPAIYAPDGPGIRQPGPFPCSAEACMAWREPDPRMPGEGYCALIERPT